MMRNISQNTDDSNIFLISCNHIWNTYPEYDLLMTEAKTAIEKVLKESRPTDEMP